MHRHLLDCEIVNGKNSASRQFIPRIGITPSDSDSPIAIKRVLLPIHSTFAMTINKAQGATLAKVGVYLNDLVFSH